MARILIVEDDGLLAGHMAQAPRGAGHAPVLALDVRAALREAISRADLILLDLALPDLPGEALLGQLRQIPETAAAPVVVVTGKRENAERLRRERPVGLADILLKPVSNGRLCRAVRTALPARPSARPPRPAPALDEWRRRELIRRLLGGGPRPPGLLRLSPHVRGPEPLCATRHRRAAHLA
jgi:DNA-binding response OmpR family regulator